MWFVPLVAHWLSQNACFSGGTQGVLVVEGLIYMKLKLGAATKVTFQSIGSCAWGLKPLYALISDGFSIGGYRRAPWVILTSAVATLAYVTLVLDNMAITGPLVCLCFFFAKLQVWPSPLSLCPCAFSTPSLCPCTLDPCASLTCPESAQHAHGAHYPD